jgi:hypothetical protein
MSVALMSVGQKSRHLYVIILYLTILAYHL